MFILFMFVHPFLGQILGKCGIAGGGVSTLRFPGPRSLELIVFVFFHPDPWGFMIPNLTVAYFSNGLVKNHQLAG